jgi:hypothetical protein
MTAYCFLPGSPTIGWYSGVVVLDVVRGGRVFYELMFHIMHVQTFVEECRWQFLLQYRDPVTPIPKQISYKKKQWRPPSKK